MLYLLHGNNQKALDGFIENLLLKNMPSRRVVLDNFKEPRETYETLLKGDTLFGEKIIFVLKDFPKNSYKTIEGVLNQKELDIVLYYLGSDLSLKKTAAWVESKGGLVRSFGAYHSKAVFLFLDGVSKQNLNLAVVSLRKMRKEKENLFLGLTFLFTRIEKLALAKYQNNPRLTKQAASFKLEKLLTLQERLLDLEDKLKSTPCDPWQETENWLVENLT